jgi:SAM-dependent methyltransferase
MSHAEPHPHHHAEGVQHGGPAPGPEEYWEAFYGESERIWSGNPNVVLVREVSKLTPGRALDLGCGEGADAIWLAEQGWQVTATDISEVALGRAAAHATRAGVAERITWQRHDLAVSLPEGAFDLISSQFLHSKAELPREAILRTAASRIAPGGVLLIEGHGGFAPWEENPHPDVHFPTPDEVVEALALPEAEWELLISEDHERTQHDRDGHPATRPDTTVMLRRRK